MYSMNLDFNTAFFNLRASTQVIISLLFTLFLAFTKYFSKTRSIFYFKIYLYNVLMS